MSPSVIICPLSPMSLKFFKNLFRVTLGLHYCEGFSHVAVSSSTLPVTIWTSHHGGFSYGASSRAHAYLPTGMWDLPRLGGNPCLLHCEWTLSHWTRREVPPHVITVWSPLCPSVPKSCLLVCSPHGYLTPELTVPHYSILL